MEGKNAYASELAAVAAAPCALVVIYKEGCWRNMCLTSTQVNLILQPIVTIRSSQPSQLQLPPPLSSLFHPGTSNSRTEHPALSGQSHSWRDTRRASNYAAALAKLFGDSVKRSARSIYALTKTHEHQPTHDVRKTQTRKTNRLTSTRPRRRSCYLR